MVYNPQFFHRPDLSMSGVAYVFYLIFYDGSSTGRAPGEDTEVIL